MAAISGPQAIAVVNAGSSSLKFSLFDEDGDTLALVLHGNVEALGSADAHLLARDPSGRVLAEQRWPGQQPDHAAAMTEVVACMRAVLGGRHVAAVGHRIVHGGSEFTAPARLDAAVLDRLARLTPLAPLHQPHNLAPARALLRVAPQVLQVGCFDTAFHACQPELAQAFALPADITRHGVRRYGFHGLSYEYLAGALAALDPALARGRVIAAHLGNGASLCALDAGRSIASTMGFTALDGLPMGTRCGNLDPGVLLYLIDSLGMTPRQIEDLLYRRSGLLGVSGIASDLRALEASDAPEARFAIELFVYRVAREIGSLAAALGGLDGLVFAGGIGEHGVNVRGAIARAAGWLGLRLDAEANAGATGGGTRRISTAASPVAAWVVPTDEELMIARHALRLLDAPSPAARA